MYKHIILWKLREGLENPERIKEDIKKNLEDLNGVIDGITLLKVHTNGDETSSCDIMLDSAFVSREAYLAYKVNPAHVKVADTFVRPNVDTRLCLDFEDR